MFNESLFIELLSWIRCGTIYITISVFSFDFVLCLKRFPKRGILPKKGTLLSFSEVSSFIKPLMITGSPDIVRTWVVTTLSDVDGKVVVDVAYTDCKDKAEEFREELNTMLSKYGLTVGRVEPLSLAVACHIGDGSIAVAISRKR